MPTPQQSRLLLKPARGEVSSLLTGLVAYWTLNEGSGTTRLDSSGNGHSLTDNNTVGSSAGKIGNAASVTVAVGNFLSAVDAVWQELGSGNFTFGGWWKTPATITDYYGLFAKWINTGQLSYLLINNRTIGDQLQFQVTDDGTNVSALVAATTYGVIPTDTWLFIVVRRSGNFIYISINAGPEDSVAYSGTIKNGTDDFTLAGDPGASLPAAGLFDEWGFWNVALTPTQIANWYNSGTGVTYPFVGVP